MNVGAKKGSYFGPMIFSSNFLVHPLTDSVDWFRNVTSKMLSRWVSEKLRLRLRPTKEKREGNKNTSKSSREKVQRKLK